jgi:hypothetical protein
MPSDHTHTEMQASHTEAENEETLSIHESVPTEFRLEEQIGLVYSSNKTESTGQSIIQSTNHKRVYILCIHRVSTVVSLPSANMGHINNLLPHHKQCPFNYHLHDAATAGK